MRGPAEKGLSVREGFGAEATYFGGHHVYGRAHSPYPRSAGSNREAHRRALVCPHLSPCRSPPAALPLPHATRALLSTRAPAERRPERRPPNLGQVRRASGRADARALPLARPARPPQAAPAADPARGRHALHHDRAQPHRPRAVGAARRRLACGARAEPRRLLLAQLRGRARREASGRQDRPPHQGVGPVAPPLPPARTCLWLAQTCSCVGTDMLTLAETCSHVAAPDPVGSAVPPTLSPRLTSARLGAALPNRTPSTRSRPSSSRCLRSLEIA